MSLLPKHELISRISWLASVVFIALLFTSGIYLINRRLGTPGNSCHLEHCLGIMSWNIGKLPLRWDSRAADDDLNYVASVIRGVNPHLVALQELKGPGQLGRLLAALGPGWRGAVPQDHYDRRAALLVRLPAQFFDLATSTGRTAQAAITQRLEDERFTVVSLHLDAFDAKRRLLQAEEILAGAQRLGQKEMILAGDFNLDPGVTAQGSEDQDLYRFLTREMVDAAQEAGATTLISRRLDYVFYRSSRVKKVVSRILRDRRINIMDHDPLVVIFFFER